MTWDAPHLLHVRERLQAITDGDLPGLIVELPPRHGKSEMITMRYPVYRLARNPEQRVIVGSYNQTLANKFSRRARKIATLAGLPVARDRKAAEEWDTEQGGTFRAVGVGAGVTGQGADLIVIDDPVKNRREAESATYREAVWDWFTNDLYTRREPGAAVVIVMTRWHLDDLVGRVLASPFARDWERVRIPALAEDDDPLGRAPGEALWPARFTADDLAQIRTVLGRDFDALYQQAPIAREGGMFRLADLARYVEAVPAVARRVRYWDTASSDGHGDRTAGVLMAEADGVYYIEDVVLGQWASAERKRIQRATAERDNARHFGAVKQWQQQEPGSGGKDQANDFIRLMAGIPCSTEPARQNKELGAEPLAAQVQGGNVRVLRGAWNAEFVDELVAFPSGRFDDQVDGAAGAFRQLAHTTSLTIGDNPLANYRG